LVFTSNVTVETFFSLLDHASLPENIKIAVIGERTKKVLLSKGIVVDFVPNEYVAEAFVEAFLAEVHPGDRVLIPKGNLARDYIAEVLRQHGVTADEVVVYETFLPEESKKILAESLDAGKLDVLLFTSPSTIDHFMEVVEQHQLHDKLQECIIGCIGPVTHDRITSHNLNVHIMPEKYTVEDLVDSTVSFFE
jgi:uroporphyrinogen-III synthase